MGIRRIMVFIFLLLWCSVLQMLHLHGQETDPGFISIDCGSSSEYYDDRLKLKYATDDLYVDSGENTQPQESAIKALGYTPNRQSKSLRSFPNGTRNCYTLRPTKGKNNTYLIRASFFYGNYDGKNQIPKFEVHIGVNYWITVDFSSFVYQEIIYVTPRDEIEVCLINSGNGIPYISTLEMRLLANSVYQLDSTMSLLTEWRVDIGSSREFRYPVDNYDRIWEATTNNWKYINTTLSPTIDDDAYKVPGDILKTAQIAADSNSSLQVNWERNINLKQCIYFHFFEVQSLPNKQRREFNIFFSNGQPIENISLEYLKPLTVISPIITGSSARNFSITATDPTSQYPPVLNAIERFNLIDHPNVPTSLDDVNAILKVKKAYNVAKDSWQGDPCMPKNYSWEGLNCSYDGPPRVVSLNLSSSMLTGDITTTLSNLLALETLDMSHNQLTGQIPEFLGKLPHLKVLDLSGNNLSGSIPETIQKKIADKSLTLSVLGNQNMCLVASCQPNRKKKNDFIYPVIASVATLVALLLIVLAIIWRVMKRKENGHAGGAIISKTQSFTYSEVQRITENLKTVIGKGGFGNVYLGTLPDGPQVAVKRLSELSHQGFNEFQSEVQLLSVVHHRNLVSLVGYCNDSKNMVLIYEFMERGNVRQHLSESNPNILTWNERLRIALDVAQGLDYLHYGCKPAIIHGDLKNLNILLNESMQAKIADFGLSKAFATENGSHITAHPAGTPGYLDPEFYSSLKLNKKSDVYSYGIVLLELVTGRPPIIRTSEGYIHHLPKWVTPMIESGDIHSIVDPRLNNQFNINSAWKVVKIAMSCVRTAIQRPNISQVLLELKEFCDVETAIGGSHRMEAS